MTNMQFEALVGKLEKLAKSDPAGYQLRVVLLALLGNTYLAAIVFVVFALFIGAVASIAVLKVYAIKLVVVIGAFLLLVLKAIWVEFDPPEGIDVVPEEAPELFALIDGLRRMLNAPRFHDVLITRDFNAGVMQTPRLGIFGGSRNYLCIGLPLMKSLGVEQFKAVLAHEFGHLAKGHGAISNKIYLQRLRWRRLMTVMESRSAGGSFLIKPFVNWFVPYFSAYSFPMARANEYAADATSARLTSARVAAQALSTVAVVGRYFHERYWPQVLKFSGNNPTPNASPYMDMGKNLAAELDVRSASAWLDQAMTQRTNLIDTHPALQDRLRAIGEPPCFAFPEAGLAADQLLGDASAAITEKFESKWKDEISTAWAIRYKQMQDGHRRLAELDKAVDGGGELSISESLERAALTNHVGEQPDKALSQLHELHQRVPDNVEVCFLLGTRLLDRNEKAGWDLVEQAMKQEPDAVAGGCTALRDYCLRNGRQEEAQVWQRRLLERMSLMQAAAKERNELSPDDEFDPHGLSDEALGVLRSQLKGISELRSGYLVRKRVKYVSDRRVYVFCYSTSDSLGIANAKRAMGVLPLIQSSVQFPGDTFIVSGETGNHVIEAKVKGVPSAKVF